MTIYLAIYNNRGTEKAIAFLSKKNAEKQISEWKNQLWLYDSSKFSIKEVSLEDYNLLFHHLTPETC